MRVLATTVGPHLRVASESDPPLALLLNESPPGSDGGASSSDDDELELMMEASQTGARWLSLEPPQATQLASMQGAAIIFKNIFVN